MIKYIKDVNGNIKYAIKDVGGGQKQVTDKNGSLLGFIRNGQTFDKNGTLVSRDEDISALTC